MNYVTSFRDDYAYSSGNSVTFTLDKNELHKYTDFCDAKNCQQKRMVDMYFIIGPNKAIIDVADSKVDWHSEVKILEMID